MGKPSEKPDGCLTACGVASGRCERMPGYCAKENQLRTTFEKESSEVSNNAQMRIAYKPFAVESDAYCAWDPQLPARNILYIKLIDPTYFEYIAETN